jgi:hypothetical protein
LFPQNIIGCNVTTREQYFCVTYLPSKKEKRHNSWHFPQIARLFASRDDMKTLSAIAQAHPNIAKAIFENA